MGVEEGRRKVSSQSPWLPSEALDLSSQTKADVKSRDFRWTGSTQFIWHTQHSKLPGRRILTSRRGKPSFPPEATPTEKSGMDHKFALILQCPLPPL